MYVYIYIYIYICTHEPESRPPRLDPDRCAERLEKLRGLWAGGRAGLERRGVCIYMYVCVYIYIYIYII